MVIEHPVIAIATPDPICARCSRPVTMTREGWRHAAIVPDWVSRARERRLPVRVTGGSRA